MDGGGLRHTQSRFGRARLLAFAVAVAVAGCSPTSGPPEPSEAPTADDTVTVASFDFSESHVLAEIYAQTLEAGGYRVERVLGLGSREIVEPALQQGLVDLVPEYTGSALRFLERRADAASPDSRRTHERLREAFAARGVAVLAAAPAQNQNTFAVRRETASELGLVALSDLRPVADDLVLGGPPECPERPACLRGLADVYGLRFARFRGFDQARNVAAALEGGEIDVGVLFTTDPSIRDFGFVALADDAGLQPAENVVPVVRADVVDAHGEAFVATLDAVSRELTTSALTQLNRRVQVEGEDPAAAAADWLATHVDVRRNGAHVAMPWGARIRARHST